MRTTTQEEWFYLVHGGGDQQTSLNRVDHPCKHAMLECNQPQNQ